jgi:hypothetical protein
MPPYPYGCARLEAYGFETDWRGLTSTSSAWSVSPICSTHQRTRTSVIRSAGFAIALASSCGASSARSPSPSWLIGIRRSSRRTTRAKSFTMSRLAAWWLDVHPIGEAFVVTTAPTTAQVEAILWREIGKAHRKGNLPGRITLDAKWYMVKSSSPTVASLLTTIRPLSRASMRSMCSCFWMKRSESRSRYSMQSTLWRPT